MERTGTWVVHPALPFLHPSGVQKQSLGGRHSRGIGLRPQPLATFQEASGFLPLYFNKSSAASVIASTPVLIAGSGAILNSGEWCSAHSPEAICSAGVPPTSK